MVTTRGTAVNGTTEAPGPNFLVEYEDSGVEDSGNDGPDEDFRPLHPRLTEFGQSHKFPYRDGYTQDKTMEFASLISNLMLANAPDEERTEESSNFEELPDQQAFADDPENQATADTSATSDSNNNSSTTPVVTCPISGLESAINMCADGNELKPLLGLCSSADLETGGSSHKQEQSSGKGKEVQNDNSVPTGDDQRTVSAEDLTRFHCGKQTELSSQTIHVNNTHPTSSSSLQPSHPSSSVPISTPKTLETQDNQGSSEQQTSKESTERLSLNSATGKKATVPYQESSSHGTPYSTGGNLENLRDRDLPKGARFKMSTFGDDEPQRSSKSSRKSRKKNDKRLKEYLENEGLELLSAQGNGESTAEQTTENRAPIVSLVTWPGHAMPEDLFTAIAKYLSREDICNLRLVNREFSVKLQDAMFRSIVVPFTPSVFTLSRNKNPTIVDNSESIDIFEKLGDRIYKFGMSFEMNEVALTRAPKKEKSEWVYADWGRYRWHKPGYTRFGKLNALEETADQSHRMKRAFSKLNNVTELGVVIDSGYGWLNGADMSDNAIWHEEKPQVFGRRSQPNETREKMWNIHFEKAQSKSIHDILADSLEGVTQGRINYLTSLPTSSYDSFRNANAQPFPNYRNGVILPGIAGRPTGLFPHGILLHMLFTIYKSEHTINQELRRTIGTTIDDPEGHSDSNVLRRLTFGVPNLGHRYPVFPLIFSGINASADVGGADHPLSKKVSPPQKYPLKPNQLTEPQTEWLRETGWAATAFMTSYICAIIDNKGVWGQVRTLNLSGISSGMLLNFDRADLYEALPKLATLTVLVIPDWQESEAISSQEGPISLIGPERAAEKFFTFLSERVAGLEGLRELTVGYIGGGEHAAGMFARNQHVLPAPIIKEPRPSEPRADKEGVLTFGAIVKITFKNCWFSPALLKKFLKDSVALEEIVLDSCSLTALPGCTRQRPPRIPELFPVYSENEFFLEELREGTWANLLNRFTPGLTLEERHVISQPNQGLMAPSRPDSNLRRIELNSCGYVKLSSCEFNQNSLPIPDMRSMDHGLQSRFQALKPLMMGHEDHYPLLGTIVQAIGEDEEQVLKFGFGMHFGWGDDMARWRCVEDGFFESGTGRFSGVIEREKAESHADDEMFLSDDESHAPLPRD